MKPSGLLQILRYPTAFVMLWILRVAWLNELQGSSLHQEKKIHRIEIVLHPEAIADLRKQVRGYVRAEIREGTKVWANVGIHLKGSTGSFQGLDAKPSWTLNFGRYDKGQRFHGLKKIHLNNAAEDPSCLNEFIGSELFLRAGQPAPEVSHAVVELNGRRLGLYVLKEGFTADFLGRHFKHTDGNLYDTGEGHDVDEALHWDSGRGPADRTDLQALAAACRISDVHMRWQALDKVLDLNRFVSFMALEVMLGHRDGYCLARNNFRIYHDPDSDRMVFLPHGMDQLFGRPEAAIKPQMQGLVARAIMETPEGKEMYQKRLEELFPKVIDESLIAGLTNDFLERVKPCVSQAEFDEIDRSVSMLKLNVSARRRFLELAIRMPEPSLIALLKQGNVKLRDWQPVDSPNGGGMGKVRSPDGRDSLHIRAGNATSASWRTRVLLEKGRYRFEAKIQTRDIEPLSYGRNHGAGLRVTGAMQQASPRIQGTNPWQKLSLEIEAASKSEVELICDMRAGKGEAWFDLDSLMMTRMPE